MSTSKRARTLLSKPLVIDSPAKVSRKQDKGKSIKKCLPLLKPSPSASATPKEDGWQNSSESKATESPNAHNDATDEIDDVGFVGHVIEEPVDWEVQHVIGKRINPDTGKLEYYVRWMFYPDTDNSWEPVENLTGCKDLVDEYEATVGSYPSKKGFDRGLQPDVILDIRSVDGVLLHYVQWKSPRGGYPKGDWVSAAEANQKCPQLVIQFYEQRYAWYPRGKPAESNQKH